MLRDKHVLVRTDKTVTVAYINHQGGHAPVACRNSPTISSSGVRRGSSRCALFTFQESLVVQLMHSQDSSPFLENGNSTPSEAQVDLFATSKSSHCQLFYSLTEAPLGRDALAYSWPRGLLKYAFPPVSLLAQILCKIREDEEQVLLVAPYWPTQTWFANLMLLATAPPWKIPLRKDLLSQGMGTIWHPHPDLWNLHVSLLGLQRAPFEPLGSVEFKFLSLKTALLTALASIKRDQVVNLQALPSEEADPALALLCPVRALRVYVDCTRSFRRSEQLFVCFGGQQKGNAVSKQRLAHWVVDAITLAYESQGEPYPLGVRAQSTL
ncbi:hypothetical protein H4Q32_003854 [Labeo rohita]|uniref:Uncharacterized protein n=1 Tax=Labeo rohita TaxID=84645 RepID=A0ABQ8MX20_LABRO|nr:hypothetical protein H4Q32_003854 [Labeo rohita]